MGDIRQTSADKILKVVSAEWAFLAALPEETASICPGAGQWSIKQLVGHLVDSASNNHQRMVRLHYQKELRFPDYTSTNEIWVSVQNYQQENWMDLLSLWKFYNHHIAHLIRNADTGCLLHTWIDGEGRAATLEMMISGYVDHLIAHVEDVRRVAGIIR